jgi:hypothetical protein
MSNLHKLPMPRSFWAKFVKRTVPTRGGNPPKPPEDGEA